MSPGARIALVVALVLGVSAAPAGAATFTVTSSADDGSAGTLRAAINSANGNANPGTVDVIDFEITTPGDPKVITLLSNLPAITQPVSLNGYTQDGSSANTQAGWPDAFAASGAGLNTVIKVEIDAADHETIVIQPGGAGSSVRGLAIHDDSNDAIELRSGNNVVAGNFLGPTAAGGQPGVDDINELSGVAVFDGAGNRIGGSSPADRNLISANNRPNFGTGLRVVGGDATAVEGNLIGTNAAGTGQLSNGSTGGIQVNGFTPGSGPPTDVVIGGFAPGAGNLVSGNTHFAGAITLNTNSDTPEVSLFANRIGPDVTGTGVVPGNPTGVDVAGGPVIIGDDLGHGNLISGNGDHGIRLSGTGHVIQGNRIGTNAAGDTPLPNRNGINLFAEDSLIGGTTPGAGNLISGNEQDGITGTSYNNNDIQGNLIGTDGGGVGAIPNGFAGINVPGGTGNVIGGPAQGSDNVISGNGKVGVLLTFPGEGSSATDNEITGNVIGTNASVTAPLPNGGPGVQAHVAGRNVIGRPGEGNTIAHNAGDGVLISGETGQGGFDTFVNDGNSIRGNSMFSNGQLAIDLGEAGSDPFDDGDGVTPNDAGDGDTGNNQLQNFPVLSAVTPGASTTISGSLNSKPNTTYTLDFYASTACDPSGNGEGSSHLGSADATTDGAGNAAWTVVVAPTVAPGGLVTATATDPAGNTSELSACRESVAPPVIPGQPPPPPVETPVQIPQTPAAPNCRDRRPPITSLKRAGVRLSRDGKRVVMNGTSADHRECPSGVEKVQASLARVKGLTGVNCRFIRRQNQYLLTGRKNCRRPTLFLATGTTRWTFTFDVELKPGLYRAQARGTDFARNKETPKKRQNIVFFSVK